MSLVPFQEADSASPFLVANSVVVIIISVEMTGYFDILTLNLKRLTRKMAGVIVKIPLGGCMMGGH